MLLSDFYCSALYKVSQLHFRVKLSLLIICWFIVECLEVFSYTFSLQTKGLKEGYFQKYMQFFYSKHLEELITLLGVRSGFEPMLNRFRTLHVCVLSFFILSAVYFH